MVKYIFKWGCVSGKWLFFAKSQVKYQAGYRQDLGNPTQDPWWEWWDPASGGGIPPFPPEMKIWSHPRSHI